MALMAFGSAASAQRASIPRIADFLRMERAGSVGDNSDFEKLRTARFGFDEPDEDYYEAVPDHMRFRWKLNRLKMRMPINTAGFR